MISTSLQIYFDESNQERWNSFKARIVREMSRIKMPVTARILSDLTGWEEVAIRKRMSELYYSGEIIIVSTRIEKGYANAMYTLCSGEPVEVPKQRKIDGMFALLEGVVCDFVEDEDTRAAILEKAKQML